MRCDTGTGGLSAVMDGNQILDASETVRGEIVAKAGDLFSHYGYSKTNIGDIAQACGMSPGNLYRYFKNKQAIGHAVVADYLREEIAEHPQIVAEPGLSAEQKLRRLITSGIMYTIDHLRVAPKIVELAEMICETEEGLAVIAEHVQARQCSAEAIIAQGNANGEFSVRDIPTAARAVNLATKFFFIPHIVASHGTDRVEHDLKITLDLVCAGLRNGS